MNGKLPMVKYRDWEFEVDRELTQQTYSTVLMSGAESCICQDCENYVAFRDRIFPDEVIELFENLGIDYRKEVEVFSLESLPNGLHYIAGWFHFKGQILKGKNCCVPLPSGGNTLDLTTITDVFSIGFTEGDALTFFSDKNGLIQVEFQTYIPWVISDRES